MKEDIRIPSVERGCDCKTDLGRDYKSHADKFAKKYSKKYGVYRCPHCGGTHLTTKLDKSGFYAPLLYVTEEK